MKRNVYLEKAVLFGCVGFLTFVQGVLYARDERRRPDHPERPIRYEKVVVGRNPYFYREGRFYHKGLLGFSVITPPIGAVISILPGGFKTIVVRGATYYTYENSYYMGCPSGYIVVPDPMIHTYTVAPSSGPAVESPVKQAAVYVNVPNSNGTYTAVQLVKSDNGYTGPQGEFYPTHPTVEQLRVLYGK